MRQEEPQVSNDHPEAVRSAPVPVPPTGDRGGRTDVPEDALDDRGGFDDPSVSDERASRSDRDGVDDDRTDDEGGFHEPGPLPTTFGATTVADAVAASALASPRPQDQPDPRAERTAQPGDGAEDGEREGLRADPTAELHRRGTDPDTDDSRHADESATSRTVVPAGSTDGGPERRSDLSGVDREPDAAPYGSATPEMVDPDAVSPDADPVLAGGGAGAALQSAGTSRPAGSTVAAEPATLLDADTAQGFRDRWRDVQLRFVDDPHAAAGEAQSLVEEAIQALASALAAQKNALGGWQDAGSADTEQLRMAVRRYRDFLDRVLGR
ncbi:hypothetical protein DKT68_28620 [Micromonospora acroterricola]|uniref:Uncharacterized protein n=1 Tax=Micromonospora acroterricola TaxID=2202421 RepID=A0A317CR31_9ACTN|nr:hypothetical protein [Micromonospora acroterricola]PWR05118.1 hypothetical protein DKT68_28620 [Micromonospora acroterricola]